MDGKNCTCPACNARLDLFGVDVESVRLDIDEYRTAAEENRVSEPLPAPRGRMVREEPAEHHEAKTVPEQSGVVYTLTVDPASAVPFTFGVDDCPGEPGSVDRAVGADGAVASRE